jgi:hypothetical protein
MQEDRQPNESRTQRKGDHRVPKVRSSASLARSRSRQFRLPHPPPSKTKKNRRNLTPREHDGSFMAISNNGRREPLPLRGSIPDESATNPRSGTSSASNPKNARRTPAIFNISNSLASTTDSRPGRSPKTPNDALHVVRRCYSTWLLASAPLTIPAARAYFQSSEELRWLANARQRNPEAR